MLRDRRFDEEGTAYCFSLSLGTRLYTGKSGGDISMTKTTVSVDQGHHSNMYGIEKGGHRRRSSGYSFEGLELPYPLSSGAGSIRREASEGFMENGETWN